MTLVYLLRRAILMATILWSVNGLSAEQMFTLDELQPLFKHRKDRLGSKAPDYRAELKRRFGKGPYSQAVVQSIFNPPKIKNPFKKPEYVSRVGQSMPTSGSDAATLFPAWEKETEIFPGNPKMAGRKQAILAKYGIQPWYYKEEVDDIEENGAKFADTEVVALPSSEVTDAEITYKNSRNPFVAGWSRPHLRKDWSDVLYSEDFSQTGRRTIDDLEGATMSYTHDGVTGTDKWSLQGAIIFPWLWETEASYRDRIPERVMFVPSASFHRITTDGDPSGETNSVLYRLGFFGEWLAFQNILDYLLIRGAAVYGTDMDHKAQLPGFEVDLEPQIYWASDTFANKYLKIGASNVLIPRRADPDGSQSSYLEYQLRIWVHAEGGEMQRSSKGWGERESFFRLGPMSQFRINIPHLLRGVSFTTEYSYIPQDRAEDSHKSLLKAAASFTLVEDNGYKASLVAEYINGGLLFTDQNADTFTIGLGIRF